MLWNQSEYFERNAYGETQVSVSVVSSIFTSLV